MPIQTKIWLVRLLDNPFFISMPFFFFAWVIMLLGGGALIARIKATKGMKWSPREDTPDSHLQKAGVPSMGGLGILGSAALAWVAAFTSLFGVRWAGSSGREVPEIGEFVALCAFMVFVLAHGALGLADDLSKAKSKGGLTSKQKLLGQVVLASLFLVSVRFMLPLPQIAGAEEGGLYFRPLVGFVCLLLVIGTSNAVNLTDGIDGLAAGLSVQVALVFGVLFFQTQHMAEVGSFATSAELGWLCLGGACLGFLAFNRHPAKVFMGDTGSLALGAALGAGAILTRSVALLPFVGFIFYVEMFSVIAQVLYFKYTKRKFGEGRRIFRRAPLHHHFELSGWSEWRVVGTFWLVNAVTTVVGLILWKAGVLPRFP